MLSLAVITTKKNSLSFQGQHSTILNIKIANIIIRKNKAFISQFTWAGRSLISVDALLEVAKVHLSCG